MLELQCFPLYHYSEFLALASSPPTALRILEEFVDLKEGDVVVQNGANSAVGQVCSFD